MTVDSVGPETSVRLLLHLHGSHTVCILVPAMTFPILLRVLIPVVSEGVRSMVAAGYSVDIVLICGFTMQSERLELVRDALPPQVGLQLWDNATPLGYKLEDKKHNYTQDITRALARQHRYVIKDKLSEYDLFACFEDDMLIKAESVQNYVEMTQELYRMRESAPDVLPPEMAKNDAFYGVMTKAMLKRSLPGFIRVEVLLDEANYGTQEELDPVPVTDRPQIDPNPCCHVSSLATSKSRPESPKSDDMFLWETNIVALGVRKMPRQSTLFFSHNKNKNGDSNNDKVADANNGWVLLQRGPLVKERDLQIRDYWSGQTGYFGKDVSRPHPKSFPHINNQGGWMATREQIWEWHTEVCSGSFLPPYEVPNFKFDGLDTRNVEYWSGGMHLFTREYGCMLQRIVSLDPDRFSKQLLYHTANNKQRQLAERRNMLVKVNDLFGQLNTARANAESEMQRRLTALAASLHH